MEMAKRSYALPSSVIQEFEQVVASGKRSALVAELMAQWLRQKRLEALNQEIIAGCKDMAEEYLSVERDFHSLEEEAARAGHD